jgi:hypothetical protein
MAKLAIAGFPQASHARPIWVAIPIPQAATTHYWLSFVTIKVAVVL